jgi:hypothetical protein
MNEGQMNLLEKELHARLPYGIKGIASVKKMVKSSDTEWVFIEKKIDVEAELVAIKYNDSILLEYDSNGDPYDDFDHYSLKDFKPYFRPMSSMTKEELKELRDIFNGVVDFNEWGADIIDSDYHAISYLEICAIIDWLNAHHFDYRGLIEKGLALVAPDGMYN